MNYQKNAMTKKLYNGRNQEILLDQKEKNNYKSDEWLTFCQVKMLNWRLKNAKGKGVRIMNSPKKEEITKKSIFTGFSTVFNKDLTVKF